MNPAFLDDMSWEMAEVYGAITDQILINLARHFPFYDAGDPLPSSAFEYQASMLAQMGQVNAETMRIIRNGLADADEALKNTLEQAIIDSVRKTSPELWKGVKKGVLMPPTMPVVSPNQYRAFQLYYTQAADKLNLVNTVMLESTKSAYAQTITDVVSDIELADRLNRTQIALDAAAGETITGVSSWNQALRHATDKLKDCGITGFVDHAGHHWSAEAYTAMDIRTTTFNTARAAVWEENQSFGNDLYIVSYHNGARPLCYPWQNKVISASNNAGVTYDLDGNEIRVYAQSETTYGEAAGLFGINCRHYPSPWIPGVSLADGKPQDKEDNDRVYAESQEQRRLERKLREEKRDLMMAKAQGRPQEELDRLQAKCRKSSEDIDTFCKETGRARHRDREAVYTKREFPDKERYNVAEFERTQKEQIEQFYKNGGAQQNYTFGQMTPNEPLAPQTPAQIEPTPAPVTPQNVASQATQTQPQGNTMGSEQLDASNFPDSFNKKKNKTFVENVNATEGTDPDVVKLFNKMGEQVNGASYPIEISYTEDDHAVQTWVRSYGGQPIKTKVKVPKLTDPEYLRQEIGTTAHEFGHLFDRLNTDPGRTGAISVYNDNYALPKALRNARPMSDRIKTMIDTAVSDGNAARKMIMDRASAEVDEINKKISKAISAKDFDEWSALSKERDKLWKDAAKLASKESRKAHNSVNAIEDIYDAISGGTLRDKTRGLYGHGSAYYANDPGGESAAAETLANYCSLALASPELFKLMAEEQPEIWEACGNIIKAMLGG